MVRNILRVALALFGVGIIIVVGYVCYLGIKLQQKEPEFRQYVTMTTEEQNAYIAKNIDEIYERDLSLYGAIDPKMQEIQPVMKELEKNPEFMQSKISWGRAVIARIILNFEDITDDLSAEVLKQLQAENDEYETRRSEYKQQINNYQLTEK